MKFVGVSGVYGFGDSLHWGPGEIPALGAKKSRAQLAGDQPSPRGYTSIPMENPAPPHRSTASQASHVIGGAECPEPKGGRGQRSARKTGAEPEPGAGPSTGERGRAVGGTEGPD